MQKKYLNCEMLYEDGIRNLNRVVKLKDGSLFTLANISKNLQRMDCYPKRQFVFGRRSFDGGKTWTMPDPLFEIPELKAWAGVLEFMISRSGYLHVFLSRIKIYDWKNNVFKGDILHARMDDITGKNLIIKKVECLDRYTGSLNNLIQLKSGRLVVPFSTLRDGENSFVSSTIYSDDEGITWKASNDIEVISDESNIESGAVEPVVAEIGGNMLVMLIRTVLGSFYYSISYNGGESWTSSRKTNIKSSNAPAVLEKLNDGRILIVWNNCYGLPMHGVRYSFARQCLHAAISDDNLKTLRGCRTIVKKEAGDPDGVLNCYPFSSIAGDSEVYIRFFISEYGEGCDEPNGKLIKMPVDFLYETEKREDFRDGFNDWVTDGRNTFLTECEGKNALCVKATEDEIGYAMLNFPYGREGRIRLSFKAGADFREAKLILTDTYLDKASFEKSEMLDKYNEIVKDSFIEISILADDSIMDGFAAGKDNTGVLDISWDAEKGTVLTGCNGKVKEEKIPRNFGGFNYAGIILPYGKGQEFMIKGIKEKSVKAWKVTGIEY